MSILQVNLFYQYCKSRLFVAHFFHCCSVHVCNKSSFPNRGFSSKSSFCISIKWNGIVNKHQSSISDEILKKQKNWQKKSFEIVVKKKRSKFLTSDLSILREVRCWNSIHTANLPLSLSRLVRAPEGEGPSWILLTLLSNDTEARGHLNLVEMETMRAHALWGSQDRTPSLTQQKLIILVFFIHFSLEALGNERTANSVGGFFCCCCCSLFFSCCFSLNINLLEVIYKILVQKSVHSKYSTISHMSITVCLWFKKLLKCQQFLILFFSVLNSPLFKN